MKIKVLNKLAFFAAMFVLLIGQSGLRAQTSFPSIEKAMDQEEYGQALKLIEEKLAADPKNERLYYLRGKSYFAQDAFANAKAAFSTGKKYGARYPWNFIGAGAVAVKENNFAEAKENFDKATEMNKTNDTEIMIGIANGYLGSTDRQFTDAAEKILYQVKSLDKDNKFAYVALGDLYLAQGVKELALDNYENAVKVDPNFLTGYLRAGQLQVKMEKYNEGADYFRKAMKVDPNYAPVYKEMGELWYKAGKLETAKENYKKYVEMTKGDLSAEIRYYNFLFATSDYESALKGLEAISKDTISLVMLRVMGYCSIELNQPEKGKGYLDKYFAQVKPKYILASDYEYMGKAYQQLKEDDKALAEFEKAIALDPTRVEIYGNLGESAFKNKDYEGAAKFYAKFAESGDLKFKDWFYYANSYYYDKKYEDADAIYAKIEEKYTNTHIGSLFRGRIAATNDPDNKEWLAKPFYEKVWNSLIEKENVPERELKDLKEAAQYLGFYYYSQNGGEQCEPSLPYWAKVLELDPENEGALQIIDFCKKKGFTIPAKGQ
ncbi:MAG: tetratricopeptide repeat protein [Bacteroidia bacterium]|nr:tetratricopeptide repeat protein [Bacteroidia bacterium]